MWATILRTAVALTRHTSRNRLHFTGIWESGTAAFNYCLHPLSTLLGKHNLLAQVIEVGLNKDNVQCLFILLKPLFSQYWHYGVRNPNNSPTSDRTIIHQHIIHSNDGFCVIWSLLCSEWSGTDQIGLYRFQFFHGYENCCTLILCPANCSIQEV